MESSVLGFGDVGGTLGLVSGVFGGVGFDDGGISGELGGIEDARHMHDRAFDAGASEPPGDDPREHSTAAHELSQKTSLLHGKAARIAAEQAKL